ncbi:MAG: formate--tetrahydrofolate ligase [Bacteroidales bacterium]|jgi:formate--tetrahydrofolate ligase|nr:formate--tetrahydrofolate ligase [Bacteroidales bacterium]
MKSDIEIARETKLERIEKIAEKVGINPADILPYGHYIAKVPLNYIDEEKAKKSNLILVTSISATKAGIGKTTVSIGLDLGLNKIGKKAIVVLREPSLGPCFGVKGGAAGGGYAQVLPMEKINLHFTGDFHAVTSAHNMITALLDNWFYQRRKELPPLKQVLWKRVLDVNDRGLRRIVQGLGGQSNGIPQESGFDITPASEIMAILCLATSREDLRRRIENILLGYRYDGTPFTVKDMGCAGAICVLLEDALLPNLVQTTENTPAIVHGGPFANIAHGCNTILATKLGMSLADYTVTEAGFGADLGAEKFLDIKCRKAGLCPKLTVVVATCNGLKLHGGADADHIKEPNMEALKKGFSNLDRHVRNMQGFGQTVLVAFNRFANDTDDEIQCLIDHCEKELGVKCVVNDGFLHGGEGAAELAKAVVAEIENNPSKPLHFTYEDSETPKEKIEAVAKKIYGAASVTFSEKANKMLKLVHDSGLDHFPVCVAKTQFSFTPDPKKVGAPTGFNFDINDIVINQGSEFIVAIAGEMMRMPGLPKTPAAEIIDIDENGQIQGLS